MEITRNGNSFSDLIFRYDGLCDVTLAIEIAQYEGLENFFSNTDTRARKKLPESSKILTFGRLKSSNDNSRNIWRNRFIMRKKTKLLENVLFEIFQKRSIAKFFITVSCPTIFARYFGKNYGMNLNTIIRLRTPSVRYEIIFHPISSLFYSEGFIFFLSEVTIERV